MYKFLLYLLAAILIFKSSMAKVSRPHGHFYTSKSTIASQEETTAEKRRRKKLNNQVCLLPKVMGPCKASLRRFYFDKNENKCKEFIYGGCMGNRNNFEKLVDCQAKCEK